MEMRNFTDEELLQIIEDDESDCVEFKESLSGDASEKIRMAICAFSNDLPNHGKPGFIFLGVKPDRTIVGFQVTDELLRLHNSFNIYCDQLTNSVML